MPPTIELEERELFRVFRKRARVGLSDIAKRMGVTTPALSKWELGHRKPAPGFWREATEVVRQIAQDRATESQAFSLPER